jgi:hypothetical protein
MGKIDLGGGNTDYGLEVFDATGKMILGATGLGVNVVGTTNIIPGSVTTGYAYWAGSNCSNGYQGYAQQITIASISIPMNTTGLGALVNVGGFATSRAYASTIGYYGVGGGGLGGDGPSCFLAGALVAMADGSFKPIEEVRPGDLVIGAFGEINEVLALDWVVLGDRWMYCINDEHDTSDDHPHVTPDKRFLSCEPHAAYAEWGHTYPVITADGSIDTWLNIGLTDHKLEQMTVGDVLQTLHGPRPISSIEQYKLPPETRLYNLVMAGSHTYTVNGYAVTGWPREDDFDYDAWQPTGLVLTQADYQLQSIPVNIS